MKGLKEKYLFFLFRWTTNESLKATVHFTGLCVFQTPWLNTEDSNPSLRQSVSPSWSLQRNETHSTRSPYYKHLFLGSWINALCLYCVLQSASVGTKASLCGFNLIMNPTLSAFFCSSSKLVWLLGAFKCWSICLSVSGKITSETQCLPLAFHCTHSAQQKGIKWDDWLHLSSSD